jgi:hypothetical protein
MRRILLVVLVACGGGGSSLPDANPACTPEARNVTGTAVVMGAMVEYGDINSCMNKLITTRAELDEVFGANVPAELANVDFAVDRVVLGMTNPSIRFVVDDGVRLVVGEQPLCEGVAPQCAAVIVHSTRNAMTVDSCPYFGPEPCLAP